MRSRPPTSSILQPIDRLGARMLAPPAPIGEHVEPVFALDHREVAQPLGGAVAHDRIELGRRR